MDGQTSEIDPLNPVVRDDDAESRRAYLVVRRGGRWSDVLRLAASRPAVIGRSSGNAVAIRSHQASRRHAEVYWENNAWWLRDLGSRNGTCVGGEPLERARRLVPGDRIEIAGFELTFVSRLEDALGGSERGVDPYHPPGATDEQLTLDGWASSVITRRVEESCYLGISPGAGVSVELPEGGHRGPVSTVAAEPADPAGWSALFRLAYRLASCDTAKLASTTTLEMLAEVLPGCAGGIYLRGDTVGQPTQHPDGSDWVLVASLKSGAAAQGGPLASTVAAVLGGGQAILVRDWGGDWERDLAGEGAERELAVQSTILAPIGASRPKSGGAATSSWYGYLQLVSVDPERPLTPERLELATAAAGVLGAALENLFERGRLIRSLKRSRLAVDTLRRRLEDSVRILGASAPMLRLMETIRRVAKTDTTVLVTGESGVGKELVAAAIHQASPSRDGPLICLNCAALSPTLLESELFGHERGAFTGATDQKKGKFEAADGGTLMLDEIGEMDLALQAKLLRVLEGHPFERLGGSVPLKTDVRLIAATNRDLTAEVAAGRFRGDLYYRLNVVEIVVPPLRERGDDIRILAEYYTAHFANKTARVVEGITERAQRALTGYPWPGNVRELKNVIERAVVLGNDRLIDIDDLSLPRHALASVEPAMEGAPERLPGEAAVTKRSGGDQAKPATLSVQRETHRPSSAERRRSAALSLVDLEREHLVEVLRLTDGNKSRAAVILGIERSTLDRKLKRYGIDVDECRS
jgi:transcriptional regulator with GAF, ATPase, and Fis domain